jgi:protein associated with RNAse G/E
VDSVELVLRKFDGRPHRQVTGRLLGEDSYGTWLATPRNTVVSYHYGSRPTGRTRADAVRLIPADGWWTAMYLAEPDPREVYCDVTTPARWTGPAEITVVDLDIDLVRYRADHRVEVEDEDEFAEHRVEMAYPDDIVTGALASAAALRETLLRDDEPFAGHYRKWLAKVDPRS